MEAKLLQSSSIEKNAALTGHYDRQDYKKKMLQKERMVNFNTDN